MGMDDQSREAAGAPVGRRVVLGMLGLGALGVAVGGPLSSVIAKIGENDPTGLSGLLPATGGFRYYSVVSQDPVMSPADYRLSVTGLVSTRLDVNFAELAAMPQTGITHDFQCVTGWRVNAVPWSGVLLSHLLRTAQVLPNARAVRFTSFDGVYTESLTMEQAMRPDVLVANSMLGGPVSDDHGGPVRLVVAPMYGYKSLKWLGGIEVTAEVQPGYWEVRGYDADAWVGKSNGRDDAPTV
jgi:DMSO/TMAO reductase YedYZ molybdopterin-dependent catalytic subunit